MSKKEEYYLTRFGKNYHVDKDNKILEKWKPKYSDHYDVLTVKVYPKDFHITDYVKKVSNFPITRKKRGSVREFSMGSIKRFKFILRNTIHLMNFEAALTYPNEYPNDGLIIKKHFHRMRSRLNYKGYKYIWTLEFQKRGAPHFHMLLDREIEKSTLAKMWFDIVKSGDEKHLDRGVHIAKIKTKEGMLHYFTSYLSKQDQKSVPYEFQNVGRFWGYSLSLLEYKIKKYYGNPEDIQLLRKNLRPMRKWYENKKLQWNKRHPYKIKRYRNSYVRRGSSFKVVHSNLFIDDIRKRGGDTSLFD